RKRRGSPAETRPGRPREPSGAGLVWVPLGARHLRGRAREPSGTGRCRGVPDTANAGTLRPREPSGAYPEEKSPGRGKKRLRREIRGINCRGMHPVNGSPVTVTGLIITEGK